MKTSPLDAVHHQLGARIVPFGGWDMPLHYADGTIAEHLACRNGAALFDVSHLGTVRVEGPDAFELLNRTFTNDLHRIEVGRAQYTHLLDESASVTDDIIIWWVGEDRFDVMPNASNTDGVRAAIGGNDVTDTRAILAVQGPLARERLATIWPEAAAIGRFRVAQVSGAFDAVVAGTGYTGEDGVEIAIDTARAPELWAALVDAGVTPAGLGARDTLRLEAGLPLHGHELGAGITPLQAGLGWVVRWDTDFNGKAALEAERLAGPSRKLRGLRTDGRRFPRADSAVFIGADQVGVVTSGSYSPVLEGGIALAFLPPDTPDGTAVEVDMRGKRLAATVVTPPFVTT